MNFAVRWIAAAGGGMLMTGLAIAAAEAPVEGIWLARNHTFTYMGITSHYSCDGLESKLKLLLRLAGARPDANVHATCTDPRGGPSPISSARLAFHVLATGPATEKAPAAPAPPERRLGREAPVLKRAAESEAGVGAWKTVELRAGTPREIEPGDCELVEQFAREVLPLFTTRTVTSRMTCVPHQVSPSAIELKFDVLAALPPAERPKAAKPQ